MKVAHLADIHIRGLAFQDEMEYTFEQLYLSLTEEKPDLIYLGGDIYHSKLTITSEYIELARKFFSSLSQFAPTIVILGNHDLNLTNPNRLDAITPVVNAVQQSNKLTNNLYFDNTSWSKSFINPQFVFHHFSILDKKEKWPKKENLDLNKINIALYHGAVNGCLVDNGWVSRGNRDNLDIFQGFDFAFLGDIHKFQYLDEKRTICYPGSLRQNNYGEDLEKGYVLWDIESKTDFDSRRVVLPQKRYFYTVFLETANDNIEQLDFPQDCRIQIKSKVRLSIAEEIKIKNKIKDIYKPCNDIPIIPPDETVDFKTIELKDDILLNENIRSQEVQIKLIKSFFESQKLTDEEIKSVIEVDKKYNSFIDQDVLRNIKWTPKKFEWSNTFSFGEGNTLDFSQMKGLIGVLGQNGAGKTSFIETFLLTIFNSIYKKGANKGVDYINNNKDFIKMKLDIDCDDAVYSINRLTEKNVTKKGEEKAVNRVDFTRTKDDETLALNGETIPDTNQNIKNIFGTLEDFIITSLSPQFGITEFIDAGATNRKKVLAKFLDLGIFDEKFDMANIDIKSLKEKMKLLDKNYEKEIASNKVLIEQLKEQIISIDQQKNICEKALKATNEQVLEQTKLIQSINGGTVDIVSAQRERKEKNIINDTLARKQKECRTMLEALLQEVAKYEKEEVFFKYDGLVALKKQQESVEEGIYQASHVSKKLENIPNVPACEACPLVKHAFDAKTKEVELLAKLEEVKQKYSPEELERYAHLRKTFSSIEEVQSMLNRYRLENEKNDLQIKMIIADIERYNQNKDAIESNGKIESYIGSLKAQTKTIERDLNEANQDAQRAYKSLGVAENKIDTLLIEQKLADQTQKEYYAYQLYLEAMGKNGIAYQIMSQRLPVIQQEVNKILSQVVDYRVEIIDNDEEKSIKMYMIDPIKGKRILELASGAEKTVISLALRVVLWNISSLPKTSILILDEPFGHLDVEKFDSVVIMLDYLKNYFEKIFIITHDEQLKVFMDDILYISKSEDGFVYVKR